MRWLHFEMGALTVFPVAAPAFPVAAPVFSFAPVFLCPPAVVACGVCPASADRPVGRHDRPVRHEPCGRLRRPPKASPFRRSKPAFRERSRRKPKEGKHVSQPTGIKKGIPLYPNLVNLKTNTMKNTMQRYGFAYYVPSVHTKNLPSLIFFHGSVTFLPTSIYKYLPIQIPGRHFAPPCPASPDSRPAL